MQTKTIAMTLALALFAFTGVGSAAEEPCTVTSADPASVITVGDIYIEDRDGAGVPGSGLIVGGGTWVYQESNGLPGLQRGGSSAIGEEDSVNDETCGAMPDTLIF